MSIPKSNREATAAQLAILEEWIRAEYAMRTHAIEAGIANVDWLNPETRVCLTEIVTKAQDHGFPTDRLQLSQLMQKMARGILRKKATPATNNSRSKAAPFVVSAAWIEYAHRPGADSGHPTAKELCELPGTRRIRIPAERKDLVLEIISVAELYVGGRLVDAEDRGRALSAKNVIRHARRWMKQNHPSQEEHT